MSILGSFFMLSRIMAYTFLSKQLKKQARKNFFEKFFWRNCLEFFWIFGVKCFGILWEDFLGRNFLGGIFWENFFGRNFLRGIFGRNSLFTLLKLFEYERDWFVCQDFGFCQDFVSMKGRKEGRILRSAIASTSHLKIDE